MGNQTPISPSFSSDLEALAQQLNQALQHYSDKEWSYSRITLVVKSLTDVLGPYALTCEFVNRNDKPGRETLRVIEDEIQWGESHAAELGILEIISLRLNKALKQVSESEAQTVPVIRISTKETLQEQGITSAFWYQVEEVRGDEFENR